MHHRLQPEIPSYHGATAIARRKGAAVVELAMITPVFFALVIGIIEFGRLMMVQQIVTNASREGARRGIIEGATSTEVETLVNDYLTNASIPGATVTVTPSDLGALGLGDPVTVAVSVPYENVDWVGVSWFLKGTILQASTVMRAERLQ
jgi:Flp pilus assembly protein TadG